MKRYYLGIDTSCYTTSCAIIDSDFHIVGEARKLLEVKPGERVLVAFHDVRKILICPPLWLV